jgi:sugar lactone lactonase YvrE
MGQSQLESIFVIGLLFWLSSMSVYGDVVYYSVNGQSKSTIYKMDSNGSRSVFATLANTNALGLAFDNSGNLYVANEAHGGSIIKIGTNGEQSIFATLYRPRGVAFDSSGNLYASCVNGTIAKIDSIENVSQFGSGPAGPLGIAFDNSGNLYVAEEYDGTIMKFDQTGNSSIFARLGLYDNLAGIAFDRNGILYVNKYSYYGGISKIDSKGVESTFVEGLPYSWGLAFDSKGILYSAVGYGQGIAKIDSNGQVTFIPSSSGTSAIAVQIPEPATLLLLGLGGILLRKR